MNPTEQKTTVSEAVRKHKEFLFPAVATYFVDLLDNRGIDFRIRVSDADRQHAAKAI